MAKKTYVKRSSIEGGVKNNLVLYNYEYYAGDFLDGNDEYIEILDNSPTGTLKDKINEYITNAIHNYDFGNLILRGLPFREDYGFLILPFIGMSTISTYDADLIGSGSLTDISNDFTIQFGIINDNNGNELCYLCCIRYFKDIDKYGMKFIEI